MSLVCPSAMKIILKLSAIKLLFFSAFRGKVKETLRIKLEKSKLNRNKQQVSF